MQFVVCFHLVRVYLVLYHCIAGNKDIIQMDIKLTPDQVDAMDSGLDPFDKLLDGGDAVANQAPDAPR